MEKLRILTKSNFRKNKGTCVGLFLLIMLASMMIDLALLLFFDAYPTSRTEAERLEAGDGYIWIMDDINGIDDAYIEELIGKETTEYYTYRCLGYPNVSIPFGNGTLAPSLLINDSHAFEKKMDRTEIVFEDESIKADYIYLPYQFNTSGGYELGDKYSFELMGNKYTYTVKGFLNSTYFGCNNCGVYEFVIDSDNYAKMFEKDSAISESVMISFNLKEGEKLSRFRIQKLSEIADHNPLAVPTIYKLNDVIVGRSFMSLVLAVSFLTMTIIIVLVITVMLTNSISNYIRENMPTIGVLKALGYTSSMIRRSLYTMFTALALVAGIVGSLLSYALMPIMAKIIVGQMGVPYSISFNPACTISAACFVVVYVLAMAFVTTGKIKKIDPIVALHEGIANHSFKKNRVRLEKSIFSLNFSLALKNIFNNKKQNIITFFVTGLLVFICVIGLLMFENFSRNPKLGIITFEICSGNAGFDYETKEEALEYLESLPEVSNLRSVINLTLNYEKEDSLLTYVFDDTAKMNNKEACYKGRLPKYDNEIAISGKFASDYDIAVGDEISLELGSDSYKYLVTGFIQTCNNYGREAIMMQKGAEHVMDFTYTPAYYWFDCENREVVEDVINACSEKYGDHMVSSMNFYDTLEGNLTTFRSISTLMLAMLCVISAIVITIILYLLIKAFVYNKRKDFGIYKALGYTSNSLILQTALSFMPSIVVSAVIFSIVSYFAANPYMSVVMHGFGLMKSNFNIPILGVVMIGIGIVVISFAFAIIQSVRVKKIESYEMLMGE